MIKRFFSKCRATFELLEDTFKTGRSLRRLLASLAIEPFFRDPPGVIGGEADLLEAIYEARTRPALSRINLPGSNSWDPENMVWETVGQALAELVTPRVFCGRTQFSIRDIDEIQLSKTHGIFKSITDFGLQVARYYPCETPAEFDKATGHAFPTGKRFTIVHRSWTGRYRWHNEDGSHHAAVAQRYALTFDADFHFAADLYKQLIESGAVETLRQTIRGFLLPTGGIPSDCHIRLSEHHVPFQTFALRIHGKEREILLVYPGTGAGRLAADTLLSRLDAPEGELTAMLTRSYLEQAHYFTVADQRNRSEHAFRLT